MRHNVIQKRRHARTMKKRLCCLCLCAQSLSVLVTVLATNYNYDSTTIPYYEEILEEEPITQALTGDDVPESIISYSDTGGLRVQIPSRPWFKEIAVYGYINRSADWDPYRIPELSIERTDLTKLITGPNEKGEWVMETKKFDLKSGDNGFINFCVWVANELCLMGKSKTFRFTKLSNGTWITEPRGFKYKYIPGLHKFLTTPPWYPNFTSQAPNIVYPEQEI